MKYFYFSLGCKVNSYECAAISSLLKQRGYVFDKKDPDIVIINTCAVTSTSEQKSRQHVRKFRNLYPNAIIVVMGCAVQADKDAFINDCNADIVIGTSSRNKLLTYIDDFMANMKQIVDVSNNTRVFKYEEFGITSCSENVRAYLKIQDGCNNFCSYCLIPLLRGNSRSRNSEEVIKEANYLVESGYQEIVVSGIDIGSYGLDNNDISFSELIEKLLDIKGLKRLRISSLEASQVDDKLLNLYKTRTNLVSHLHIPLQSGSASVLQRMNRKYDKDSFLSKIKKLKQSRPDIALTTDVIVGFPGETSDEFNETVSFVKECGFNMLHVFPYSSRKNTKASREKDQVSPEVKKERVHVLLELSNELWNDYCKKFIGKEIELLVERYDKKNNIYVGHTGNYIEYGVKSNKNIIGEFINTKYKS